MSRFQIFIANVTSWIGTVAAIEFLKDALQVIALFGSIAVSGATLWWIRRQARSLDRKDEAVK